MIQLLPGLRRIVLELHKYRVLISPDGIAKAQTDVETVGFPRNQEGFAVAQCQERELFLLFLQLLYGPADKVALFL